MSYKVTWHIPNISLLLTLCGDYTVDEAIEANQFIVKQLDQSQSHLCIIIDATQMNRPFNFENIRKAQTFMDHSQLRRICVASEDRLVRLSMLVIFNLSKAYLHWYEDLDTAKRMLNIFEKTV